MRWILGKTGVHDQVLTQPLLFIRWRKYDETPSKRLQVPVLVSGTDLDATMEMGDGPQKVLVTEAGWVLCLRKVGGDSSSLLTMKGMLPTRLQSGG